MKKVLILLLILTASVLACPSEEVFRDDLKKGLFSYLQNPAESRVTLFEVKDMLVFYLTTDISSSDCDAVTGAESGLSMSTIISKAESVHRSVIPHCSDGTPYGECSSAKPMFCYSGMLRYMCNGPDNIPSDDDCGCPGFEICQTDGSCYMTSIACFSDADCGTSMYLGQPHCQGNSIYQNYLNFTCYNPGTASAYCDMQNELNHLMDCSTCHNGICI